MRVISRFQELIAYYADFCASKKKGMSILHLLEAVFLTGIAVSAALKALIVTLQRKEDTRLETNKGLLEIFILACN